MSNYYILEGKKTVPVDLMTWAKWFWTTKDRHVACEKIGDVLVSTVFLGLDHSFGDGPPMLFETMVFGGPLDKEQNRCTTWEEAEAMHKAMVERVQATEISEAPAEYDLTKCPVCGGPADNGYNRCIPPSPYLCTKCEAAAAPNVRRMQEKL